MNQNEFHRAVRAIAGGKYFSTRIEVDEHAPGRLIFEYSAYITGQGWTVGPTAESVLSRLDPPDQALDTLDALPSATVPA